MTAVRFRLTRPEFSEDDLPLLAEAIVKAIVRRNVSAATLARATNVLRRTAAGLSIFPGTKALASLRMHGIIKEFMRAQMRATLNDYLAGERSVGSLRWWWYRALREHSESAFKLGKEAAGDDRPITWLEQRRFEKYLRNERVFLRGFLADLESNTGKMNYSDRLDLYIDGTGDLYARGMLAGASRTGKSLRWKMGPTVEHCADCLSFDGKLFSARQFRRMADVGRVPQGHGLECKGFRCLCRMEVE